MSPASIGGGSHLLFPVVVQSTTGSLNDGALPLIEKLEIFVSYYEECFFCVGNRKRMETASACVPTDAAVDWNVLESTVAMYYFIIGYH